MGEVWLANDTLLNRPVALKYLKGTQDPLYEALFLAEARTLASLIIPILPSFMMPCWPSSEMVTIW